MSLSGRSSSMSHLLLDRADSGLDLDKLRMMRKNKLFRRIEADIKERDRKRKPGTSKCSQGVPLDKPSCTRQSGLNGRLPFSNLSMYRNKTFLHTVGDFKPA